MGTRHATTNAKYKLIDDIINLNKNIDKQVIQNVQNSETDPILKGKHLTSAQQQRQFDFCRVPKDESLQCYILWTQEYK